MWGKVLDKKMLITGSILSVVILILVSFASVVGDNRVKSSAMDSPLFSTRINNAIDRKQSIQTCNYLGKGRATDILFPTRDSNSIMTWKIINRISTMSEEEFNRFIRVVTHYVDKLHEIDAQELIGALHQLNDNSAEIQNYIISDKDDLCPDDTEFTVDGQWAPGCILGMIVEFLFLMFFTFGMWLATILNPQTLCGGSTCMGCTSIIDC